MPTLIGVENDPTPAGVPSVVASEKVPGTYSPSGSASSASIEVCGMVRSINVDRAR